MTTAVSDKAIVRKEDGTLRTLKTMRAICIGIGASCPLGMPLDGCVATDLRNLDPREVARVVAQMSADEVDTMVARHKTCMVRRQRADAEHLS